MTSYLYIAANGDECLVDGLPALLTAIEAGEVSPETSVREATSDHWLRANEVVPSAFQPKVEQPEPAQPWVPGWVALFFALGAALVATRAEIGFVEPAHASGRFLAIIGIPWLLTRFVRSWRPHWPTATAGLAAFSLFVGGASIGKQDQETSAALDQLDSLVAGFRSEVDETQRFVDSVAAESEVPPAPTTKQEENAAIVRTTQRALTRYKELDAALAEEHGVHVEPNSVWLENDYYVRPNAYPDVRSYFVGFRNYVVALREGIYSERFARTIFGEALEREGLGGRSNFLDDAMRGFRARRVSQDTMLTVMEAYATKAIELHDELLRFEGSFYVDPASGALGYSGVAPTDNLIALEESVGTLATEMLAQQERSVGRLELLVDSMRGLARR